MGLAFMGQYWKQKEYKSEHNDAEVSDEMPLRKWVAKRHLRPVVILFLVALVAYI